MRKRVALFTNGWSVEYLQKIGNGVMKVAGDNNIDLFNFISFTAFGSAAAYNMNEHSIFRVPDLRDFDGVILLTNSFNLECELSELKEQIEKYNVPAISFECQVEGMDYIGANNYSGMYDLSEHLFQIHGVKKPLIMGGIKGHEESETRIRAVKEAALKSGIHIHESDIMYGNWSAEGAVECLQEWLEKHDILPEAVICVNDVMAMGVCDYMKKSGYRVPEDCIVTGFDGLLKGQQRDVILTSVNHQWEDMGRHGMEMLLEKIEGRQGTKERMIDTSFLCGESCGCIMDNKKFVRYNPIDGFESDQHFRHMYGTAKDVASAEQLNWTLSYFFSHEHWMEGNNFMLCINNHFFETDENAPSLPVDRMDDTVEMVCALHNGESRKRMKMPTSKSIFRVCEEAQGPQNYILVPVSGGSRLYGFGMLVRDFDICFNNVLYIWTRHMSQYLKQIRTNAKVKELTQRLEKLSVTDALSGVYNRTGLESICIPFMERIYNDHKRGMTFIVDIDCMKKINDTYGHAKGDLAVRTVAEVLKKYTPEDFFVVRYGGDEFVVLGEYFEGYTVEKIKHDIQKGLNEYCREKEISFELSISIGGFISGEKDEFNLEAMLQCADENMYAEKRVHHEKMGAENNH